MSRWNSYLNTATRIIEEYDGKIPLSNWLKAYFSQHKQMGSKDRKTISDLLYGFYRIGHSTSRISIDERILLGIFLCQSEFNSVLNHFRPEWNLKIQLPLHEKVAYCQSTLADASRFQFSNIFPWRGELSSGIDAAEFNRSFLQQPDLFLRLRPGKENWAISKLKLAGIPFEKINDNCLALPNSSKIDSVLTPDKHAVVQDYSSQCVGNYMMLDNTQPLRVWDCCAASGGKSIMAVDINPRIQLTVSDVRTSILANLHRRFELAGIKHYDALVTDLSVANSTLPKGKFDCIIADLPCTGSGTWARTPERLYFFDEGEIDYYSTLQKKILENVAGLLKPGGILVYITCSVFKRENELMVEAIQREIQLELLQNVVLTGYNRKADSMFVAVFRKDN